MRILILRQIAKNSVDDIFGKTDYNKYELIRGTNVGNKLWLMGLVSSIATEENQIDFLTDEMTIDYINSNYDICIKPEANIFSVRFIDGMKNHVSRFGEITIPIYVIACGAQADSYDELNSLYESIKYPANEFIRSIYKTGGEFCLRGYFTKELFNKLGYKDAVVTGCPSMYQYGRDFSVQYDKVTKDEFKPALNGTIRLVKKALKDYENSEFFDQSEFFCLLYKGNESQALKCVKKYGYTCATLIEQDRLNLFIDMQDWMDYFLSNNFSFSCGSRIHGNIMPILSGTPAAVCSLDSRTREMAEFFDIPIVSKNDLQKRDLYEVYSEIDYSKFNTTFSGKYDCYERFLVERGIVRKTNKNPLLSVDIGHVDVDRQDYITRIKREHTRYISKFNNRKLLLKATELAKDVILAIR